MSEVKVITTVLLAFIVSGVLSFAMTPLAKKIAFFVGAIDIPTDARRMHKSPIPRLGGLAIFAGFIITFFLFGERSVTFLSIILGAGVIVILGFFDDIFALSAKIKFTVQLLAATIPVIYGVRIESFSNPNFLSENPYIYLGVLSVPITIIWIVGITNAVNLVDGLDGLAVGVSSIASLTVLAIGLLVGEPSVAIIMACLAGACVGFMPYNINPAKMFMGDTGAMFLGFILATVSVQGLFKFYAVISFAVPFLILALPIFDTGFAIIRRILTGKSPMSPDRGHVHHRLIDMGFNQKQTVAILYGISAILGLTAVLLTSSGELKAIFLLLAIIIAMVIGMRIYTNIEGNKSEKTKDIPK